MNRSTVGLLNGIAGVVIFSGSLVATRLAVVDIGPVSLTAGRAAVAGACGGALLLLAREPLPRRDDLLVLAVVALGVVVGFPFLSALALTEMNAARATVFTGLLPLATAVAASLRAEERPRPSFWVFAILGSAIVAGFAASGAAGGSIAADGAMLGAVVTCGIGYAEGARLTRRLGGWQVISWALVLSLPVTVPVAVLTAPDLSAVGAPALAGFAYVSLFSMLIGFVFWYRGLAIGGIAAVGQVQLLQPFLGLAAAAAILGEPVGLGVVAVAAAVLGCVAAARRVAAPARPR